MLYQGLYILQYKQSHVGKYLLVDYLIIDLPELQEFITGNYSFYYVHQLTLESSEYNNNLIIDLPKLRVFEANKYSFYNVESLSFSGILFSCESFNRSSLAHQACSQRKGIQSNKVIANDKPSSVARVLLYQMFECGESYDVEK